MEKIEPITKRIDEDILQIFPLGGGQEVGRSCIMIKFKGKLIMVKFLFIKSLIVEFTLPETISQLCPFLT